MGLMPDDYYNMLPVDFDIMMNGHVKRLDKESSNYRKAAFLICASNGYKGNLQKFSNDFWRLSTEKKDTEIMEAPDKDFWEKAIENNKRLSNRLKSTKKKK